MPICQCRTKISLTPSGHTLFPAISYADSSDQPSAALRGGAEHTRAGVVRARAFMLIFAAPALIPAPFIC